MTELSSYAKRRPVVIYYLLVFVISWGGMILVGGSSIFAGSHWQTDPLFMAAVQVMLAGPPVAGLLMTALVSGTSGFRELLSRLLKGRVGLRWYVIALLSAPLVQAAVLLVLAQGSPVFLPAIVTAGDKAALLQSGIIVGLLGGLIEELGWTGFAVPRLTPRFGILRTGLIVGVLWGVWHLLQMAWVGSTSAEVVPQGLFLSQYFLAAIAQLTAFRILMVWVYDRTGSLLLAVLMHASYIFSTLFVLAPPTTGTSFLTYSWVFTIVLWVLVAAVLAANRGQISNRAI